MDDLTSKKYDQLINKLDVIIGQLDSIYKAQTYKDTVNTSNLGHNNQGITFNTQI